MPINASYEYFAAEKKYLAAQTAEEKISCLEEMIRKAPKHKSSENFIAELKQRLKKLTEKQEKAKKSGKTTKKSIRKEGFQVVLVGLTNSGKSSLLSKLTNAHPKTGLYSFTTKSPEVGTLHHQGFKIQIIDLPSIGSENFDMGLVNTADLILIVIDSLDNMEKVLPHLTKSQGKKLIVINKSDLLTQEQLRKVEATTKSKKIEAIIISCMTDYNLTELKNRMITKTNMIRVYTKEPGKPPSKDPVTLPLNSTVKDVAESIRKGFHLTVKESRITGPSSKFPNQKVGISHILKDQDVVEFHTK